MLENLYIVKCLYRRSRDGATFADFHKFCDNKGKTLVVIKIANGPIIGGYSDILWNSQTNNYLGSTTGDNFLFVLRDDLSVVKSKCKNW